MSVASSSPLAAYRKAILAAAGGSPTLEVVEASEASHAPSTEFAERLPKRYVSVRAAEFVTTVVDRCAAGGPLFATASSRFLLGDAYPGLARSLILPRRNVKLVGVPSPPPVGGRREPAVLDDVGTMRGLPSMTVVAPADGPTVSAAVGPLADRQGPAYLRLPSEDAPTVGDGAFSIGHARELRPGNDLTIVAWGPTVHHALEAANELARVGIGVRILDVASVKPFDEAAVLRAARDTGAIVVVEAAPLATGVGTLVAAMTAENYPVPVRRLGFPDLWPDGEGDPALAEVGVSTERLRDEAWELLRLRGRIA